MSKLGGSLDGDESVLEKGHTLSVNAKRKLRRKKLAAAGTHSHSDGVKVLQKPPAQPVTAAKNDRTLNNNAPQRLLKRKNFDRDCETDGKDEIDKTIVVEKRQKLMKQESTKSRQTSKADKVDVDTSFSEHEDTDGDSCSDEGGRDINATIKRRLRRKRVAAAKAGLKVPYDPVSKPPPADEPKLSNHAKRMIRIRKKFDRDCEIYGEEEMNLRMEAKMKEQRKKEKKRQKGKLMIYKMETQPEEGKEKMNTKSNAKHIVFGESEDIDEPPTKCAKMKEMEDSVVDSYVTENTNNEDEEVEDSVADSGAVTSKETEGDIDSQTKPMEPAKKRRFILFVGNLSYTTTEDDIKLHFAKVGHIVNVRMPKPFEKDSEQTCRGFCYLEVKDEEAYLKGLSMHHSYMSKRKINVEYSSAETKQTRVQQKPKRAQLKAMARSGDMFELLNPTHGSSKILGRNKGKRNSQHPSSSANRTQGSIKAVRKSTAKRNSQNMGNKFWI